LLETRTSTCGSLRVKDEDKIVVLYGWVASFRQHGALIFINLRDRYGITQVVFDETDEKVYDTAYKLRQEFVIKVKGKVRKRPDGIKNINIQTGEIEVLCNELEILSISNPLPISIDDFKESSEELSLKYRYLDLRRSKLQKNFILRHKLCSIVRSYLSSKDYLEIETPILSKTTPEGARDYLVPSRLSPGAFYALPQSPQTYKQLLMIAGFDKYFQIVKCFRDEDLRSDRQPEFTQIDIEVSFTDSSVLMAEVEFLFKLIWKELLNIDLDSKFPVMTYDEAVNKYGSDKPDLRFNIEIEDFSDIFKNSNFSVFKNALIEGKVIKGIVLKESANLISRKDIEAFEAKVKAHGFSGLAWFKLEDGELKGSIAKFVIEEEKLAFIQNYNLSNNSIVFILSGACKKTSFALGVLRNALAEKLDLIKDGYKFLWINEFPLLEYNEEDNRYYALHHPFTSPVDSDKDKLIKAESLTSIKAKAYDLVCNGMELGGGSMRIYTKQLQEAMFKALSISEEDAKLKFGFFLEALNYGTPPHGGIAFGLDRIAMILCKAESIREVIAFPKTQKAIDLMSETPSFASKEQTEELCIVIKS